MTTTNTFNDSDDERAHRKRHAAKLRQRRCREKKRLASILGQGSASAADTKLTTPKPTAAATAVSRKTNSRRGIKASSRSPVVPSPPACSTHVSHDAPSIRHVQAIPYQRLAHLQQPQLYVHHAPHSVYSPYVQPRCLPPRYYHNNNQPHLHLPLTRVVSSPMVEHPHMHWDGIVSDESIVGSSSDSSTCDDRSPTSSPTTSLDTQEAAAIDAMLALFNNSSPASGDDMEDLLSTVSSRSDSEEQVGSGLFAGRRGLENLNTAVRIPV